MRTVGPLKSLFFTILAQTIAFTLSLGVRDLGLPPLAFISVHALAAALIAKLLKVSWPWLIFNLILPFGLMIFSGAQIPNWLIGSFVGVIFLIYLPTFFTRVPFFATHDEVYDLVSREVPDRDNLNFIDIGCGFGGLLFHMAEKRPKQHFTGIELSPMCWLWTKLKSLFCKNNNVTILYGNFWKLNFAKFDVVYAFLAPPPMPKVWKKVKGDRGTELLLSYCFEVPEVTPARVQSSSTGRDLFTYKI